MFINYDCLIIINSKCTLLLVTIVLTSWSLNVIRRLRINRPLDLTELPLLERYRVRCVEISRYIAEGDNVCNCHLSIALETAVVLFLQD